MVCDCRTVEGFRELLATSDQKPLFVLKHSTRCPISASRWRAFQGFAASETRADFYRILVVEDRPLSQYVARQTGVVHQSPQVILFHRGRALWHDSHSRITENAMARALAAALAP